MAQTVEEIAEILNSMKIDNETNSEGLGKILTSINARLEVLADDNESSESSDIIKMYLSELQKMVEDKHNYSVTKFTQIQTAFDELLRGQENTLKTSEISEMFQYLTSVINNFSNEISMQKEVTENLEKRLIDLNGDTSDKDEIINFISTIKSDFENVSNNVSGLGDNFSSTASANFENIKETISILAKEINKQQEEIKAQAAFQGDKTVSEMQTVEKNLVGLQNAIAKEAENHKGFISENIDAIKSYISEIGGALSGSQSDSEKRIAEKLCILESVNQGFESSLIDVNVNLQSIIKNLMTMDVTDQNDIIKRELENIYMASNAVLESLKIFDQKNDDLAKTMTSLVNYDNFEDSQKRLNIIITQASELAEQVALLPSSADIENVSKTIKDLEKACSTSAKSNYENLSKEIFGIADRMQSSINTLDSDRKESFEVLKNDVNEVFNFLKNSNENTPQKTIELLASLSIDIKESMTAFEKNVKTDNQYALGDLNNNVNNIENRLNEIKELLIVDEEVEDSSEFEAFRYSIESLVSTFDNIKTELIQNGIVNAATIIESFTEIYNKTITLVANVEEKTDSNMDYIGSKITEISDKISALEIDFKTVSSSNVEAITGNINGIHDGIAIDLANNLNDMREIVSTLSDNVQGIQQDSVNQIKENNENQFAELKTISYELSNDYKSHIENTIGSLRGYISELNAFAQNSNPDEANVIIENLSKIEAMVAETSQGYHNKLIELQNSLSQYVETVEKASLEADMRVKNSINEVKDIKFELANISEMVKNSDLNSDEKHSEILSGIDEGIQNIISSISEMNISTPEDISEPIYNNFETLDYKFDSLLSNFEEFKESASDDNKVVISGIAEKINTLKQEINLANTDMLEAFGARSEEIIRSLEPLKNDIAGFFECNFDRVIEGLKTQVEFSYLSISTDFHNGINQNQEAIDRLGDVYKETLDKIAAVEECIVDQTQNNLELIRIAVENVNRSVDLNLDKTNSFMCEWKNEIEQIKDNIASVNENCTNSINNVSDDIKSIISDKLSEHFENIKSNMAEVINDGDEYAVNKAIEAINQMKYEIGEKIDNNVVPENNDNELLEAINAKIDILAISDDSQTSMEELHEKLDELINTDDKIAETIQALHQKIDVLSFSEDMDDFDIRYELEDIKNLIKEQRQLYGNTVKTEKTDAIDNCLGDLQEKIDEIECNVLDSNAQFTSDDIKESVLTAFATVFEQISFVEETEEIKDFVEEKTDEISQQLINVSNQLKRISNSDEMDDYSYTLQDVESDIAKLRMALNDISSSNSGDSIVNLSENINRIASSMDGLQSNLTQEEIYDLKDHFEKLNVEILSLSTRTNMLLLNSDESYQALSNGLDQFSNVIYQLEERISYLDSTVANERLEKKLDNLNAIVTSNANSDKVFHQVLMYLGEWIDTTTEKITEINNKTSDIEEIKYIIDDLKELIPDKSYLFEELEHKFEEQQTRLDRLEMKLEKVLSAVEEKDDTILVKKMDKLESQISRLGLNIEKLASYVDEE